MYLRSLGTYCGRVEGSINIISVFGSEDEIDVYFLR